jgi:hypothetical protein
MSVRVAWKGLFAALVIGFVPVSAVRGEVLLSEDFSGGDGGFTVTNVGAVENPWAYDAAGFWSTGGSENVGSPTSSSLVSPVLTTTVGGPTTLTFSHRHSFELDTVVWDGGAVQISVNGGAYAPVPGSAFTSNGYGDVVEGNNALIGLEAFVGVSPGYANGELITSVAELGDLAAGDTVSIAFLGAWDEFARATPPNWVVSSVSVTSVPEPGTLALGLVAMAFAAMQVRRRRA